MFYFKTNVLAVALVYGLPKIHKPGIPFRPIVPFVSSRTYALSKYLAWVLSPLVGNSSSFVAGSSKFVSFLKTITIPDNYEFVSFDVLPLFTNVPIELALSVVEKRLDEVDVPCVWPHTTPERSISVIIEAMSIIHHLLLQWDYIPADLWNSNGLTGPVVVANIVMEHIALSTSPVSTIFWKRYVDDVLLAVPADQVNEILAHIDHNIQFTLEREGHAISFLEV